MSSIFCKKERAQIGLIESREHYPTDIGSKPVYRMQAWMGIYVSASHPLSAEKTIQREQLHSWRELRLNTYIDNREMIARGPVWSAPNYLLLLSMAVQDLAGSLHQCSG